MDDLSIIINVTPRKLTDRGNQISLIRIILLLEISTVGRLELRFNII